MKNFKIQAPSHLYKVFEDIKIGYISGGKMYKDIKEYIRSLPGDKFRRYSNEDNLWDYVEFMDKRVPNGVGPNLFFPPISFL